jgi:hypothetical protein
VEVVGGSCLARQAVDALAGVVLPLHGEQAGQAAATLVEAVGFYLLFTGDARPWFRTQKSE